MANGEKKKTKKQKIKKKKNLRIESGSDEKQTVVMHIITCSTNMPNARYAIAVNASS